MSWAANVVGGDSIPPGYFAFSVDDFEGTTPTGGNFFHSNGTELKHWYPISAVSSGSALNIMLNKKYGRDTVRLAGANPKGKWRTKAAKRSPRYTTKLTDVLLLR